MTTGLTHATSRRRAAALLVASIGLIVAGCGGGAAVPSLPPSATAAGAASVPATSAPSSGETTAAPEIGPAEVSKIRWGTFLGNLGSVAPIYIAIDKGFYEEEGLQVEVLVSDPGPDLAAISGGSVDVGMSGHIRAVDGSQKGLNITMVGAWRPSEFVGICSAPGVDSVEDLGGVDVGLSEGVGDPKVDMRLDYLKAAGWDLSTVDYQNVEIAGGVDARMALVWEGRLGLSFCFGRHLERTVENGGQVIVAEFIPPDAWLNNSVWASDAFIASSPNALTRFLRATVKGMQFWVDLENQDEILEIMAKNGFKVGDVERSAYKYDPEQYAADMAPTASGSKAVFEANQLVDPGFDTYADFSFLHNAQQSLGLPPKP
jgi:ABC-type nitrate/sulfonate/bicarbonate transport system substrate-binding protein